VTEREKFFDDLAEFIRRHRLRELELLRAGNRAERTLQRFYCEQAVTPNWLPNYAPLPTPRPEKAKPAPMPGPTMKRKLWKFRWKPTF
jgi:hypothetical protein